MANMEKHNNMRLKSHTWYDTGFYQAIVVKHFIKRNRAKITIINEYCKD